MKEIDVNGDGEIDFDEFMAMMQKASYIDDKIWSKISKDNLFSFTI